MVEKRLLAVFIVTCALGLALVLDLLQVNVHSVIPCLCSLPTEPSPEGLQLGDYVCAVGLTFSNLTKNPLVYGVSYFNFGGLGACWGAKPTKAPVVTGLVTNRRLFRKLYYQTMPTWT